MKNSRSKVLWHECIRYFDDFVVSWDTTYSCSLDWVCNRKRNWEKKRCTIISGVSLLIIPLQTNGEYIGNRPVGQSVHTILSLLPPPPTLTNLLLHGIVCTCVKHHLKLCTRNFYYDQKRFHDFMTVFIFLLLYICKLKLNSEEWGR